MYTYSAENAQIYSQINILGTTYEISFNEVSRLLGNLQGKTVLDFGTGTGRSARFLQMLGAKKVVGVDRDKNMIAQAQAEPHEHIVFSLMTEKTIPLPSEMIDIALSAHALVETRTLENIRRAVSEVARVLRPESLFLLISTNPFSI
ncbi:MAG TPA: class I SAM-dependent methyltransferase [Ktedonobacteraceae bacterium]|nr:class I SAM-dependent methyltransferase [Ktedonobacteraceae bacterium]